MVDAQTALAHLKQGNQRFISALQGDEWLMKRPRISSAEQGQQPFAIILGCSDSRVPAEMVFDQGLGDLFVIRVAGNIVQPSQIGSVEFAAAQFATRLVVVMGHTHCGAIKATVEELSRPSESQSPNLKVIVDKIAPAVKPLLQTACQCDKDTLLAKAVRANVHTSVEQLRHGSAILEQLIANEDLMIVGAEYDIETGKVIFFED